MRSVACQRVWKVEPSGRKGEGVREAEQESRRFGVKRKERARRGDAHQVAETVADQVDCVHGRLFGMSCGGGVA